MTPIAILTVVVVFIVALNLMVVALITVASWTDRREVRAVLRRQREAKDTPGKGARCRPKTVRTSHHPWAGPCAGRWHETP